MKYLITEFFSHEYFISEDTTIDTLVDEMYGGREGFDLDEAKKAFFESYDVYEIRGELVKIDS